MHPSAEEYLLGLPRFAEKGAGAMMPGLDRIRQMLARMGNPQESFTSIHVGGTNGKGSTASMVSAMLTKSGMRTGLHTSPHLLHITERMRVDGEAAPQVWLWQAVDRRRAMFGEVQPSFFEATVALSFLYFAEMDVDAAVIEVGLGGRLDATNIIAPAASVITNVSLEHTDILGPTLEAIARQKAGIIKERTPVVVGVTQSQALSAISSIAEERHAPLIHITDAFASPAQQRGQRTSFRLATRRQDYGELNLDLAGDHQVLNATLAILAAELVVEVLQPEHVQAALGDVRHTAGLRGRLEVVREAPPLIIDVAHNADGLDAALRFARQMAGDREIDLALALMQDKDIDAVAGVIRAHGAHVHLVPVDSPRAFRPQILRELLASRSVTATAWSDTRSFFQERAGGGSAVLVAGSHLIAADALRQYLSD